MVACGGHFPEIQKVSGTIFKKIHAGSIILHTLYPSHRHQPRQALDSLLWSLIDLFKLQEDDTILDEQHFVATEDLPGY